ncbi:hypothetical protein [Paenibacillus sp. YAF4_2]|uniref:hypothetical protein n=1 Tax=Paenibacillus sp. YAF4_2 TaxID=3233085 RepID=UPI003F9595E1
MKDLTIGWLIGIGLFFGCGYFLLGYLKEIAGHVRNYKSEKADRRLRWWYLDWVFMVLEAVWGSLLRPSLLGCVLFWLAGIVLILMEIKETWSLLFN